MFDKADDELIERLIKEAEAIIEEELQKKLSQDSGLYAQPLGLDGQDNLDDSLAEPTNTADAKSADTSEQETATPTKKRRGRPPKSAKTADDKANSTAKTKSKTPFAKSIVRESKDSGVAVKEAILEFVEREDGVLTLQEVGSDSEPMVTIAFSEQAKSMIGHDDIQLVGQSMIHAAIATVMQKQMNAWHAHVYDEVPKRFS